MEQYSENVKKFIGQFGALYKNHKKIFRYLQKFIIDNPGVFPTNVQMGKENNFVPSTVKRLIENLQELGFLRVEKNEKGRSNYFIDKEILEIDTYDKNIYRKDRSPYLDSLSDDKYMKARFILK